MPKGPSIDSLVYVNVNQDHITAKMLLVTPRNVGVTPQQYKLLQLVDLCMGQQTHI